MSTPSYMRAPACIVQFAAVQGVTDRHDDDGPATVQAVVAGISGQVGTQVDYYDGGRSGKRFVFLDELSGNVTFTNLQFNYASPTPPAAIALTTDDVLPITGNLYAVTISFGGAPLFQFPICSAEFNYPTLTQRGAILMAQGNYPYKIWDPSTVVI